MFFSYSWLICLSATLYTSTLQEKKDKIFGEALTGAKETKDSRLKKSLNLQWLQLLQLRQVWGCPKSSTRLQENPSIGNHREKDCQVCFISKQNPQQTPAIAVLQLSSAFPAGKVLILRGQSLHHQWKLCLVETSGSLEYLFGMMCFLFFFCTYFVFWVFVAFAAFVASSGFRLLNSCVTFVASVSFFGCVASLYPLLQVLPHLWLFSFYGSCGFLGFSNLSHMSFLFWLLQHVSGSRVSSAIFLCYL